jgi:DNA-binding LytR/AlgR family response regulator
MFETEKPDLVILDIKLEEEKDGIDLAVLLKEKYKTPFIFLTANSDSTTLERAKKVRPLAFLVKPFSQVDLHATIEIAFNNYRSTLIENNEKNNFVLMKVGRSFEKVNTNEILFLENDNHYFNIHFSNSESITVRASSTEIMDMLPQNNFIQISRTYIVNTDKIIKIDSSSVFIGQNKLEYKATLKEEILKMIG